MKDEPATRWVRARVAHVVLEGDRALLVGDDGAVREVAGASAALVEAVLDELVAPRDRDEVVAAIAVRAGGDLPDPRVVDDALALLAQVGAIRAAPAGGEAASPAVDGPRVVLGITGAVGSVHTPALVAALHRRGCDVWIAATRAALAFAPLLGLEALTHRRVVRALWSRDPATPVPHLALAAWAELLIVCPASASTIARLAAGDHGSVVAAAALATRAPVVIAPAMNPVMLAEPAVARNLEQLRADGFFVVPPGLGVEVADAPADRVPATGGAPPAERMVDLALAVLRARPPAPRPAIDWEAQHAAAALGPDDVALDDELVAALAAHATPPGVLVDVGTGTGAFAMHAARAGYTVVATDVAPTALARARARAGDLPIAWLVDDITDSRLAGGVAVAIDRGVLHFLPDLAAPRWAHTMARLVVPGGLLLAKLDAPEAPAHRRTQRYTAARLTALLAPAFELVATHAQGFAGRHGTTPATLFVLRRRSP